MRALLTRSLRILTRSTRGLPGLTRLPQASESPTKGQPIAAPISVAPHLQCAIGMYMNCQVKGRLVLRRNCFGVSDRRVQDARRSRHRGCARPCTGLDARSVGCPILSNHHFDLPWAGNRGGLVAEKLVKVLPS